VTACGSAAASFATPFALAHHSPAAYDMQATRTVEGTIVEYEWGNPVSPFTLLAKTTKGRRPIFEDAVPPKEARSLYQLQLEQFYALGLAVPGGRFGAAVTVSLENDGPVTLSLGSRSKEKREKG
jgi:D-tyrosyl-tRNA(Tyr) deacylase